MLHGGGWRQGEQVLPLRKLEQREEIVSKNEETFESITNIVVKAGTNPQINVRISKKDEKYELTLTSNVEILAILPQASSYIDHECKPRPLEDLQRR